MMSNLNRIFLLLTLFGTACLCGGCQFEGDRDSSMFADMLDSFSPPTPSEAARDAFNVYDADKRRRAVNLLATSYFGHEEPYVRTYRLLIDDQDPSVRAACVKALGLHGTVDDVSLITPKLKDVSPFVRWEAAQALQRIHNPIAVDPLRDVLVNDEDADVRMTAADALGQYPTRPVFDSLVGALIDSNFGVARAARRSLVTLTGSDQGSDPSDWMAWSGEQGSGLFQSQQAYVFQPYDAPPKTLEKMKFWEEREPIAPQSPIGLDDKPVGGAEG